VAQDSLQDNGRICISCDRVINAAGPWLASLVGGHSSLSSQQWASAVNIVVKKRLFKKYAVGLEGYTDFIDKDAIIKRGKRLFFFVPWREKYTMVGTTYKPHQGKAEDLSLSREELQEFLDDINKVYPAGELTLSDVTFYHAGLLPMDGANNGEQDSVQLNKSSQIIDHSSTEQIDGFYSIKGVKYTTAPVIAKDMVNILRKKDGRQKRICGSYVTVEPLNLDHGPMIQQLGNEFKVIKQHLEKSYGTDWRSVVKYLVNKGGRVVDAPLWLSDNPPMLEAEVMYFIHDEMALTLSDVILRRSNIGAAEEPEDTVLATIADVMARELDWSEGEKGEQIVKVKQFFTPLRG
jgi:glycerol-3-phosphate dehydrogenase